MGRYESDLLLPALAKVKTVLQKQHDLPEHSVNEMISAVEKLNFPAFLSLLAIPENPRNPEQVGSELIEKIVPRVIEQLGGGVNAELFTQILEATLVEPRNTDRTQIAFGVEADQLDPQLLNLAVSLLAEEVGVIITQDQAQQIAQLLTTGQFFRDISQTTATVFSVIPTLPINLVRDISTIPHLPGDLLIAANADLEGFVGLILRGPALVQDILDNGRIDNPPQRILSNVFEVLYSRATLASIARTINTLTSNQTVRLALVIYARMNNIPLEEGDFIVLNTSIFNTSNPDLGPVLALAFNRLVEQQGGVDRALSLVSKLH